VEIPVFVDRMTGQRNSIPRALLQAGMECRVAVWENPQAEWEFAYYLNQPVLPHRPIHCKLLVF
jgi:hypothetical protein